MPNLILIRGTPGSGKSTLARTKYVPLGYIPMEADMFFEQSGTYLFEPAKIGLAHSWCQRKTREHLAAGRDVVVSNTFTTLWEMIPYIDMVNKIQAKLKVIHAQGNFQNVHSVPQAALDKMKARWQPFDGEEIYIP